MVGKHVHLGPCLGRQVEAQRLVAGAAALLALVELGDLVGPRDEVRLRVHATKCGSKCTSGLATHSVLPSCGVPPRVFHVHAHEQPGHVATTAMQRMVMASSESVENDVCTWQHGHVRWHTLLASSTAVTHATCQT